MFASNIVVAPFTPPRRKNVQPVKTAAAAHWGAPEPKAKTAKPAEADKAAPTAQNKAPAAEQDSFHSPREKENKMHDRPRSRSPPRASAREQKVQEMLFKE